MPANNEGALTPAALPAVSSAPVAPMPLSGVTLALGTIALSLATFMNVLDTSIANVSIPAIAGDLAVSPDQGTWVITSFGVANAISLPLTGWLTQRYGTGIGRDDLIDACACAVAARDSNARLGGNEVDSRGLRMEINY